MLGFSEEFIENSKVTKVWLNFTLSDGTQLEFHEDRVSFNGFVRDTSTTVDGQFTVGAAVTGKLTLILDNTDDVLSAYDFRGATVVAWLGGVKPDETNEKVNAGRYYIDEYTYDGSNVTLVGYDDMVKFDVPCKGSGFSFGTGNTQIKALIDYATSSAVANIPLWNATITVPTGYYLYQQPKQWDTMTWHDVISYCAQIIGCFAHIVYVPSPGTYKLKFEWYDTSQLTSNQYDGGTFDTTTTPYSDGATLNGGSFNPWNAGDVADDGAFGDRSGVHIIPSPYDLSVDTDDVQITGVSVTLDPSNNIEADENTQPYTYTLGDAGYVYEISDNPLVEIEYHARALCSFLNNRIYGMRFRPLSASVIENPSMEAGDVAIVTGRNENTYSCFLSHVTYSVNAATQISCDAESSMQNLKSRFSGAQKIQAMVQRVTSERAISNAETAMVGVLTSYASSRGLYQYTETDSSGGTIYTYGNADTLAHSNIRWRVSAGSIMVSTDYGHTWNSALSADGTAVMQSLYAVGINADYIEAGDLTLGGTTKNVDGNFYLKDAQGNLRVTMNKNGIFNGKTSINDTTHTGFYLYNDGLIIGDGAADRYARITPDGIVYIHDNLNPTSTEVDAEPSFVVEGINNSDNPGRLILSSSGIELEETVNGVQKTLISISADTAHGADSTIITSGDVISRLGTLIATSPSANGESIYYMAVEYTGAEPFLRVRSESGFYGVEFNVSDQKLKTDIHDSSVSALDAINKIQHRSFNWKRSKIHVDNGYVAQELEKVIPDATYDVPQDDGSATKQIRLLSVVPYLSKAIQELSAKVDALEARLAELEGR